MKKHTNNFLKNQEEYQKKTDKCNDAPPVYIDAIPRKDAIEAEIITREEQ